MSRHARRRPVRTALLALLAILALDAVAHSTLILFLLLTGGAVLVWRRRRRTARPVLGRAEPAEVTRMRAQLDQADSELKDAHRQVARLEQELATAQEGMHRAWDQAASVTPRPQREPSSARDRLVSDRMAGVHDLFGRDQ